MNIIIELLFHLVITIGLLIHGIIWGLLKQIIPYKYRCKSVKDEIVLITGAGSGIGKLMAKKFASLGARCILVDVDEANNNKTAHEILQNGGRVKTFKCDLSNKDEIYSMAKQVFIFFITLIFIKH